MTETKAGAATVPTIDAPGGPNEPEGAATRPSTAPAISLALAVLAVFVGETVAVMVRTGGRMMYSLDDPYIHLRMAEQIAHGTYGINDGVPASASSSILWPFLLAPFTALGAQDWVPLVLNLAFTIAAVFVIDRIIRVGWAGIAAPSRWLTAGIAFAMGLALNLVPLAFTGLEHSLQLFLVLAAVLGLVEVANGTAAPRWLGLVVVLLPLIRYEMMLPALATAVFVAAVTRRWTPLAWLAGAFAAVGAFAVFLIAIGLPPLPGSVMVKSKGARLSGGMGATVKRTARQIIDLWSHILEPKGRGGPLALAAIIVLLALLVVAVRGTERSFRRDHRLWLCVWPVPVILVHISFVGNSDSDRYNAYLLAIVATVIAGVALPVLWERRRSLVRAGAAALGVLLIASFVMFGRQLADVPVYGLSIFEQQYQMHRLVTEELREPVAVNDLGLVAYRNPNQVLDLWGLGSDEARVARGESKPGWIDDLMDEQGVDIAIVYSAWFEPHLPTTTWIKVATLRVADQGSTGDDEVDMWARNPAAAERLRAAIERFRPSMPDKTTITLAD